MFTLDDWQRAAEQRLDRAVYDYYAGGALEERALHANLRGFDDFPIYHRVLRDVSRPDASFRLFGDDFSMPILAAPTAMQQMAHPEGEAGTAKAVARAGTGMILSTLATKPIEEVAPHAGGRIWFQLYVYKDRGITRELIRRAEDAGCKAIALTVDAPILGRRIRDERNQFCLPPGLRLGHFEGDRERVESGLAVYAGEQLDSSLSWKDLEWLVQTTRLPVLVKGLVRRDDAADAVRAGASGIVVSNHGGRQLDDSVATIRALPHVVQAAGDIPVLVDGGFRRGGDVIKALALGARAVLVGRPILWGLAVDGEHGVFKVLQHLRQEFLDCMALAGCANLAEIGPELLRP